MGYSILENLKRNNHRTFEEDYKFDLSNMQDILFDNFKSLGMDRGIKKSISRNFHKNTRQFQIGQDLLIKSQSKTIEAQKNLINKNLTKIEKLNSLNGIFDMLENYENYSTDDIKKFKELFKGQKLIVKFLNNIQRVVNVNNDLESKEKALKNAQKNVKNIQGYNDWIKNPDKFIRTSEHEDTIKRYEGVQELNVDMRSEIFDLRKEKLEMEKNHKLEIERNVKKTTDFWEANFSQKVEPYLVQARNFKLKAENAEKVMKNVLKDNGELNILLKEKVGLVEAYWDMGKLKPKVGIELIKTKQDYLEKFRKVIEPKLREQQDIINRSGIKVLRAEQEVEDLK